MRKCLLWLMAVRVMRRAINMYMYEEVYLKRSHRDWEVDCMRRYWPLFI